MLANQSTWVTLYDMSCSPCRTRQSNISIERDEVTQGLTSDPHASPIEMSGHVDRAACLSWGVRYLLTPSRSSCPNDTHLASRMPNPAGITVLNGRTDLFDRLERMAPGTDDAERQR